MPAPTAKPGERDPATIAPTETYQRSDPVWAFCGNTWCAGVVEYSSSRAATVTYRPGTSRGTGVDTITADHLVPRNDPDPVLDRVTGATGDDIGRAAPRRAGGPT